MTFYHTAEERDRAHAQEFYRKNEDRLTRHAAEFPVHVPMNSRVLDTPDAVAWLNKYIGPVQLGWRVVPEHPTMQQDMYMFRECDRDAAMLFKLSF